MPSNYHCKPAGRGNAYDVAASDFEIATVLEGGRVLPGDLLIFQITSFQLAVLLTPTSRAM